MTPYGCQLQSREQRKLLRYFALFSDELILESRVIDVSR